MNIKKTLVIMGVSAAMLSGVSFSAMAQDEAKSAAVSSQPMVLEIGPAGRVLMRGTISAVGTNSLTVKGWGGDWVVNIVSSTVLAPKAADMTQFAVGDFVGVQGMVSTSAAWTIDASLVRNWTVRKQITENKQEIRETIKSIAARNWEGVASEVNNDAMTFKLTVNGVVYDIKMVAGVKIVNKAFFAMSFNGIKNGDTVRVYGPAADGVITASVVRDVSVGNQ